MGFFVFILHFHYFVDFFLLLLFFLFYLRMEKCIADGFSFLLSEKFPRCRRQNIFLKVASFHLNFKLIFDSHPGTKSIH